MCGKLHTHSPVEILTGGGCFASFRQLKRIIHIMLNLICNDYSAMTYVRYHPTLFSHIAATFWLVIEQAFN